MAGHWLQATPLLFLAAIPLTSVASGQQELPTITVVGRAPLTPPSRPTSHEWSWSNPVDRHLGFAPQFAEASTRSLDDCGGNPVERYTGNKIEPEEDYASSNGLGLQRLYNHSAVAVRDGNRQTVQSLFGDHWRSAFDYSLEFMNYYTEVWAWRPDGRRIQFVLNNDRWEEWKGNGKTDPASYICCLSNNAAGVFTLHDTTNGVETYHQYDRSPDKLSYFRAYIVERRNEQGEAWTFTGMPQLQKVTHSSGRSVHFGWTNGRVTQVTDPAGQVYRYGYNGNGLLTSATLPGAPQTTLDYHYENGQFPGALTGKSYNGVRYSTFAYDGNGRTVRTEHAGGVERHTFAYADIAADTRQVTETNPLGRVTVHTYKNGKRVGVSGQRSAHCAAASQSTTYDANGHPDLVTDFAGTTTDYDHDAHGHLLRKIEGVGTPVQRTTLHAWDEARNRIVETKLIGTGLTTTYVYNANGRPARIDLLDLVTNQTRTTTYAYTWHANGLPATITVDAPSPDGDSTETWSAAGDLLQVRNAAGHVTTFSAHNARGQPGRVTTPAGAVTEYVYDARGRVLVERTFPSGTAMETRYVYGANGLLDAVHSADGNTVIHHYDAARRLVQEDMTELDGSYSVRRTHYDAMSQPIRVELGRD